MTAPHQVAAVSCLLHLPGLFGYNRLTVSLAAAAARQGLVEWTWVGPRGGIHPSLDPLLPGRRYPLPETARRWPQVQSALRRADRDLRPDVWHVLTDEPVPLFANAPLVITCTGLPRWFRHRHMIRDGLLPGRVWDYQDRCRSRGAIQSMAAQYLAWKLAFARADVVIAISEYVRWELIHRFAVPGRKIVVSYLAADPVFAAPRSEAAVATVRERYSLPDRFWLAVASWARTKNTPGLLRLARDLSAGPNPVPAVLVAAAGYAAQYRTEAERLGLIVGRDVFFLWNIPDDDLACVYRAAAVFVNLAWEESFALPMVEAMASGTPVVASRLTALPEIVTDGGLTVDPRDPETVARTVRSVLDDDGLRATSRLADPAGRPTSRGTSRPGRLGPYMPPSGPAAVRRRGLADAALDFRSRHAPARTHVPGHRFRRPVPGLPGPGIPRHPARGVRDHPVARTSPRAGEDSRPARGVRRRPRSGRVRNRCRVCLSQSRHPAPGTLF